MSQKKPLLSLLAVTFLATLGAAEAFQGQPPAATAPQAAPAPAAPPAAPEISEDKLPAVVAKVGEWQIRKEELVKDAKNMQSQIGRMGGQTPLTATFYRQVLDGMILEGLLKKDIAAAGITVSDADVNTQIATVKQTFPNEEAFKQAVAAQGMTEQQIADQMRDRLSIQKYIAAKIEPQVQVTDEAAKKFYDENQAQMKRPERAHLRHILVKAESTASAADKKAARDKAEALLARIKQGEDFAKLATENTDDVGTKERGGDLSWIMKGQTVEPFEKAAFALKPNEVSPVVETEFGYHVIQNLEHQPESVVPFEEAKPRIVDFLKKRDTDQKMREHVAELRNKAKIEIFLPAEAPAPAPAAKP